MPDKLLDFKIGDGKEMSFGKKMLQDLKAVDVMPKQMAPANDEHIVLNKFRVREDVI